MRIAKEWARAAQATTKLAQLEDVVTEIRVEMRDAIARTLSRRGYWEAANVVRGQDALTGLEVTR